MQYLTLIHCIEWPTAQHFTTFVASASFQEFAAQLKEFATGPPDLKLFDTDDLSAVFGSSHSVFEYLVIKPKDASEANVQALLQKLRSSLLQLGTTATSVGVSTNQETLEIAVVGVYASDAVSSSC
jgi:hypothetical protein